MVSPLLWQNGTRPRKSNSWSNVAKKLTQNAPRPAFMALAHPPPIEEVARGAGAEVGVGAVEAEAEGVKELILSTLTAAQLPLLLPEAELRTEDAAQAEAGGAEAEAGVTA